MEAKKIRMLDIVSGAKGKVFTIPYYQRKYIWSVQDQIDPLLKELKTLLDNKNNEEEYYLNTIYYLENEDEISIVDGQQRIITFFLIIHALYDLSPSSWKTKIADVYLDNDNSIYDDRLRVSFSDEDNYKPFRTRTYNIKNNNIFGINFIYIRKKINELIEEEGSNWDKIWDALKKFWIIYVKLEQDKNDVQKIFETINYSGEKLTESDLFKNLIMMNEQYSDQKEIYNNYWIYIEKISTGHSNEILTFFRYYLTFKKKTYFGKQGLYKELKKFWGSEKNKWNSLKEIMQFAIFYNDLYLDYDFQNINNKKHIEKIQDLRSINNRTATPFIFFFRKMWADGNIREHEFYEIIKILNTYLIRRNFRGYPTQNISRFFIKILKNIEEIWNSKRKNNEQIDIIDIVKYFIINQNKNDFLEMPSDDSIKNFLIDVDFYNGVTNSKWFLLKIESESSKDRLDKNQKLHIEHFMPKNRRHWKEQTDNIDDDSYNKLINRLGNLTLINPIDNSKLQNKSAKEKAEIIEEANSRIQMVKDLVKKVKENSWTWNEKLINSRSEELINKFLEFYPYIDESKNKYETDNKSKINVDFDFYSNGIKNGDIIEFYKLYKGEPIKATVISGNQVEFEEKKWLLSPLASYINKKYFGEKWKYRVQVISKFKFENILLKNISLNKNTNFNSSNIQITNEKSSHELSKHNSTITENSDISSKLQIAPLITLMSKSELPQNNDRVIQLKKGKEIFAYGYLTENEEVIIKGGSIILKDSISNYNSAAYKEFVNLVNEKLIVENGDRWLFIKDSYPISSVSKSANLILGGKNNGYDKWTDRNNVKINYSLRKFREKKK
ncbi:GmrSD restriction endonuclease domain-containing protein [Mycoplasmopsis agassizii]|uniref:DUF262 domain-containing protein n=1 Tax=Mycoplasmopsis agassizii TaxID=33922 RepID=A0ABX4H6E4_9BACT|nr:DUF262 domain-containing protein [Mycoplasmopsis agassizii]PAF55484.1 hypothetical protein CJF60_02270 [Mycoplasmopsis agassizii]SMC18984.1 Uncharacterized conserved protein, contains ParB-like and HNH nuclease domains [Mycoplasmopsis agassizii]